MASNSDLINALRESLKVTPDNIPIIKHLATLLIEEKNFESAEIELRHVLKLAPNDLDVKTALANVFFQQDKFAESLVIIEDLLNDEKPPVSTLFLASQVYFKAGETDQAAKWYRKAVFKNPAIADPEFEDKLDLTKFASPVPPPPEGPITLPVEDIYEPDELNLQKSDTSFKDVGGMQEQKDEIKIKIIDPLQHPDIYKAYGKKIGGGILLYGPPGCGKTFIARATAGEIKGYFMSIGIHDVVDMYMGQSEQNLHNIFQTARNNTPCVLFFDEVDALGAKRTDMRQSAGRQSINQFLAELDGVEHTNDGILILGATNAPWHLDSAFRRPGRFDRVLFVPPPDKIARQAIFEIMLKNKPQQDIDCAKLAGKTDNFSGADIKAVVDLAIEDKLKEAMQRGVPAPLETKDLLRSAKKINPSTKEWFKTARNYAIYANESGLYDDILKYLKM